MSRPRASPRLGSRATFPVPGSPRHRSFQLLRCSCLGQPVDLQLKNIEQERAASESLKAAQYTYKDAREMVVLAVGNAYLMAIAGAARIETADAQVTNAQALYDKAVDQQKPG